MTFQLTNDGLEIETLDDALTRLVEAVGGALGLTAEQIERIRNNSESALGNILRILAEQDVGIQQVILDLYESLSILSEEVLLDRVVRLLGMSRKPAAVSRATGPATGASGTSITNGTRIRYNPESTVWTVVDGPYSIPAGGSIDIAVEASSNEAYTVALDPAAGYDDWTILDTIPGFDAFESAAQPVVGRAVENDATLRTRAETEASRRASGPVRAIEANVLAVDGVTFARTNENRTLVTDSESIPGKAHNTVVEAGDDTQIAEAIFAARSLGAEIFALDDGTRVQVTVTDQAGFTHVVGFNRVALGDIHFRVTLTTSTSEEAAPPGIAATVQALVVSEATRLFGPGDDILPWAIEGVIWAQNYGGIDSVLVEVSDDGASWSTSKYAIAFRQKGAFAAARTTVLEV